MSSSCKYCFVKSCNSNSKRNPDKQFFRVPYNKDLRRKWCLAVGREPLNYASAAFCCCDHFDIEVDLNRIATSSSSVPILKSDVLPSLQVRNNKKQLIIKDNNVLDKPGDDAPKNLFVREVVYIEENHNDRFLEETNEVEDTLNVEPGWNRNDSTAEDVIEILDDEKSVEPLRSTNETAGPSSQNRKPTKYAPLKDVPNKSVILRHITQFNSVGQHNAVKFIPVPTQKPIQIKIQSNPTKIQLLPKATVPATSTQAPSKFVVVGPAPPKAVNKWKYLNVNAESRTEQNVRKSSPKSDDDDCVLIEEQNELSQDTVTETSYANSTRKILTTLPSSISVKYTGNGRIPLAPPSKQAPPNMSNALVPVRTKVGVREFGKISQPPNVNKVFSLIKLMISENELLLARNKGNPVKIARTKPSEFRIMDNIYYYRTNDEFENNYFFMNITRQSCNIKEIILRSYGIYWGNPRRSCVGVVETKGLLDEETKDFVFQQVKKSLFHENGRQNVTASQEVLSVPPVQHNLDQIRGKRIEIMPMKIPSIRKSDGGTEKYLTSPPPPVTMNPDDQKKSVLQSSTAVPQRYIKRMIAVQSSFVENTASTSEAALNAFQVRSMVKKLSSPLKGTTTTKRLSSPAKETVTTKNTRRTATAKRRSPAVKETATAKKSTGITVLPADSELIRLSQFLTPTVRSLINKLKYFELNDLVYSVKVCDSVIKEKPFNIVFHKNEPEYLAKLNIRPVSTLLYVSKLVSYLFHAIYPHMSSHGREPIPIPPPQDIISDATPEVMEALLISESKRTYNEIAKLEASVNNSHTAQTKTDLKHKCHICSLAFARKYQLLRHQFVTHDADPAETTKRSSASSNANILNKIPDTIRKAFKDMQTESCPDLLLPTRIKTEQPEETIVSDRSLLVPLYEELVNEERERGLVHVPLVKFKEEPEEHFEEVAESPLSTDISSDEPKQYPKKRKLQQTNADDTDSAPECVKVKTVNTTRPPSRKRKATLSKKQTFKQQRREKLKRLEKVKNNARQRKLKRSQTIDSQEMVPVRPIKISRANEPIKQWPSLAVKLADIKTE